MILRRVIEHVRAQNWTAVALDFVIVVVGVFIGIQVSNWNAARHERSLQAAYLERLADGIEADADHLAQLTDVWRREAEIGARTLRFLRDGNLNDRSAWKVLLEIYANDGWLSFAPHDVAYKELQNTGRLDMIADPQLRTAAGEYYATLSGLRPLV